MSMVLPPPTPNWRRIETTESRRMKGRIWSSTRATARMRWLGSMTMRRTRRHGAQHLHLRARRQAGDAFVGQQDAQRERRLKPIL